ncbi:uncharacterized protein LOC124180942 isoform X1 [Neodiprion fabricii]|uniref:uncharacterized protein LOC124180942 isoform X1 n=1 Tax=Neodiprion fabricii TaxID=2872261 RepID=UPI001ED908C2|nr:uncharacterized protein LOC124180942 isoform X1 [Neodiprion fabricii]
MQYITAFVLILLWTVKKLQCSDRMNNTAGHIVKLVVSPKPIEGVGIRPIILKKESQSLNLTCQIVYQKTERNDIPLPYEDPLPTYIVDWKALNSNDNRFKRGQNENSAWLWFEKLAEADAGDYSCHAISLNASRQPKVSAEIHLSVKNQVGTCGSNWFRCYSSRCINRRYLCDGMADCGDGEDETAVAGCGPDPCAGKIPCGERCLPRAWCCDLGNCNASLPIVRPDPPGIISTDQQRFNDMGFLQTTIYTVIGCAMAFMFIVTILVIMICRVHMKRAMNSRCPQQVRNPGSRPRHSVPLYDLDVYLNRTADINNQGGVTVTYNINNGVQFVGRPVEPPPYSEIAPVPPREGPPPPYVSRENLLDSPIVSNLNSNEVQQANSHSLTTEFINNEGTGSRIACNYQNNLNSASVNCFSSGQIPGPQTTPGFNRFNMSLICDNTSNTTLNTSTSTALNTSSNSDSSSNDSVGNFAICRNITSHSQNFEPEYTETDSLLTENRRDVQTQCADRIVRSSDYPCTVLNGQITNGIQDTVGVLKNTTSAEVPALLSDNHSGQTPKETLNDVSNNFDSKMSTNFPVNKRYESQILKNLEAESSFLDSEFKISCSGETRINKNDNSVQKSIPVGINSLSNQDMDSTLQRLSSKTVLDLSLLGESSKNNLSRNNSETARSLPFHLNFNNPVRGYVESDRDLGGYNSSLVIANGDPIKTHRILETNNLSSTNDSVKSSSRMSTIRKDLSDRVSNVSLSRENLATCTEDSPTNADESMERFPGYLNIKDDQMLRVPLVATEDSLVNYNNFTASLTTSDILEDGKQTIQSEGSMPIRETEPLVMPLRESFIGVRKEE